MSPFWSRHGLNLKTFKLAANLRWNFSRKCIGDIYIFSHGPSMQGQFSPLALGANSSICSRSIERKAIVSSIWYNMQIPPDNMSDQMDSADASEVWLFDNVAMHLSW